MKKAMQEIIRILLILTIQILISVLLSCLIDENGILKPILELWFYNILE